MADSSGSELGVPRRADAAANRIRLLEAAREAFAELGANAEVKDIAERAGVGVGTIYRHFGSKEDLLREVILEAAAEFEREANAQEALDDPLELLRRYLIAILTATETYGWVFEALLGGDLPATAKEGLEDRGADARLVAVLERGVEQGQLDPGLDVRLAANVLLGLSIGWKYGNLKDEMTLEEVVDRALHLFLNGAAARKN